MGAMSLRLTLCPRAIEDRATAPADSLPLAVSLEIEFEEDVFTTWPMLFASVRTDSSALIELAGEDGLNQEYGSVIRNLIDKRKKN